MCLSLILKLFQPKVNSQYPQEPVVPAQPSVPVPQPLVLLHPEEPQNLNQTVANTSKDTILQEWFTGWSVPTLSQSYFTNAIDIQIFDSWSPEQIQQFGISASTPAFTFQDTVRHLYSLASWLNPGVVAHEQGHNSYALLTDAQKTQFTTLFDSLKQTDAKLIYLWSVNSYGLTNDVEGHAETYRYWGSEMPDSLKIYYPKLF